MASVVASVYLATSYETSTPNSRDPVIASVYHKTVYGTGPAACIDSRPGNVRRVVKEQTRTKVRGLMYGIGREFSRSRIGHPRKTAIAIYRSLGKAEGTPFGKGDRLSKPSVIE